MAAILTVAFLGLVNLGFAINDFDRWLNWLVAGWCFGMAFTMNIQYLARRSVRAKLDMNARYGKEYISKYPPEIRK